MTAQGPRCPGLDPGPVLPSDGDLGEEEPGPDQVRADEGSLKDEGLAEAEVPEFARGALAALERAAEEARKIAIQTNTGIVVVRDGKIVHISVDELRAELARDGKYG